MRNFYVSFGGDLLGVYIEYSAENETALRQHLERTYWDQKRGWKLPWCSIYADTPGTGTENRLGLPMHIVKSQCGPIYAEVTNGHSS